MMAVAAVGSGRQWAVGGRQHDDDNDDGEDGGDGHHTTIN